MILHLPTGLHEDEPLYSALARCGDALPPRTSRNLLAAAFGGRTMVATMDLPARLDVVGSRLLCMRGRNDPGLDLLVGHTLFGYYASSVEPAVAARAAGLMCGDGGGIVHGLLGVRASRVSAPRRLRYCPRCVLADREARGLASWRRTHQLPGVLVCPGHAVPLLEAGRLTSSARDRLAFHSLERSMADGDRPCATAPLGDRTMPCTLNIAERSADLLAVARGDGIEALWRAREAALRDAGLGRGRGRIAVGRLRRALVETLGTTILASVGCLPGPDGSDDWVARMARPPRRSAHPLYHVLVGVLLERLGDAGAGPASGHVRCDGTPTAQTAHTPSSSVDERGAEVGGAAWNGRLTSLVLGTGKSLRAIARELGVDPLTVQRHAHILGIWRDSWSRHARVEPATKAWRKRDVALADARARWLVLAAEHPALGRKAMRVRDPAAHALLYRRDREWLDRHSPPPSAAPRTRSGVDWAARDARIAAELDAAAAMLLSQPRSPRAIRPAGIARAADHLALVQQQAARMPLVAAVLARHSQDPVPLARERLERTVTEWPPDVRSPPTASVLARAAGLNPERTRQLATEMVAALLRLGDVDGQA